MPFFACCGSKKSQPPPPDDPEAAVDVSAPATGYVVTFTDASTSGYPITGWRWRVTGSGGEVASSLLEDWTYDFAAEGPDDYDVFLSVFSNGEWTPEATDSFTLSPPVGTDDVAVGYASATSSGTTDERFVVPIVRARDSAGDELVSPATVEVDLQADGVSISGFPKIRAWGYDFGNFTDVAGDYLFAGTLEEGGALGFDSQGPDDLKYELILTTQGASSASHSREWHNPGHVIYRTRGTPIGSAIGPGSSDLLDFVPTPWAAADVARYAYVVEQALGRLRPTDADRFTDDVVTRQSNYPAMKGIAAIRWDLAMYGGTAGDPTTPYFRPLEAWGAAGFPHPTTAMGATPRSGRSWADTVAFLAEPGNGSWTQDLQNKSHTDYLGATTLTCPYRIFLDAGAKTWAVRENQMIYTDESWLDLYTDAAVAWLANTAIEGYLVGPAKIQWGSPVVPALELLHEWLYDGANPGWDVATDSGGVIPTWADGDGRYDLRTDTVLDVLEANWQVVRLLREKDPTALIFYDPLPAHVPFGSTLQGHYEDQYLAKYPGSTAQDAQDNYAFSLKEMAMLSTEILFPTEADIPALIPNDYVTLSDRNEIRSLNQENRWVRYPDSVQTFL